MSGDAMGFAVRHSPFTGCTYTVHLCLADAANDMHNNELWMANATLAKKARCSRQSVSSAMAELVDGGWLQVVTPQNRVDGKPSGHPGRYRFLFPDDVPVIFENRGKSGVKSADAPPVQGDKPAVTGVARADARVSTEPTHNPSEPNTSLDRIGCELCDWSGVRADNVVCQCHFQKVG